GSVLACLLEQVANTGGADTDYHLHELRSAHREEWNASLARYRAREQRLPGTGRSHEKNTLWSGTAEPCVLGRRLQEVHDLSEFGLGLIDSGDILEGDLRIRFSIEATCSALSESGEGAAHSHSPQPAGLLGRSPEEP